MERGDGEPPRVTECEIREARQAGVVGMHEIEVVRGERESQVGPDSDRDSEAAPPRDRERGPDGHDALERSSFPFEPAKRAAALGQVLRTVRGGEDDHLVPADAERLGSAPHVLVDRVRPRPGERRHHADAQSHAERFYEPRAIQPCLRGGERLQS
jgi:hypothetical protein